MSDKVRGNTDNLSHADRARVERLFRRSLSQEELLSPELAREVCDVALAVGRRVGLLISREGKVEEVFLGTREILYLPDLGRFRVGKGRLRRLRLVYSDLSSKEKAPAIPFDIYTDLERLRLDMVIAVKRGAGGVRAKYAHLAVNDQRSSLRIAEGEIDGDWRDAPAFDELMSDIEAELAEMSESAPLRSGRTRAALVGVYERRGAGAEESMAELVELARAAGVEVADQVMQYRAADPRTLLGRGKLEELVLRALGRDVELLIFDTELKPAQWRVITNSTELKVIDRSMLILDIFAQRAQSADGRVQVELAQLKYNLPRLVEKDAGLSRLSGGIGGRGPGETKLEISRRRIRDRIAELERRIDGLAGQRAMRRARQEEQNLPLVSVLGYTNVGKSTLFNALTGSTVLVENKLFATLDPAQRRLVIPRDRGEGEQYLIQAIISDTVGFIRDLPGELVAAFRATLEEVERAALLVHVLDASDPHLLTRKAAVEEVLAQMKVTDTPAIVVLNKVDLLPEKRALELAQQLDALTVSATKRSGLGALLKAIGDALEGRAATLESRHLQAESEI